MRGYERDEYEDWDQQGGTHQSTEELGYLALRQKLKESIRKQMKKDLGTANSGSIGKTNTIRKDNYGSFFGPSQPVIAQRVIEESKSLLENPELAARIAKKTNKPSVSAPVRLKSQASHCPSVTNGLKRKVEMIKNTRDYSFLLSDDAEVPASSKSPQLRNVSAPNSDARSAQLLSRSRQVANNHSREPSIGERRKQIPANNQSKPKVGQEKLGHTGKSSLESRKQLSSSNGSGPGRPLEPKGVPRKSFVPATGKMSQPIAKKMISDDRKPTSSSIQAAARKPTLSNIKSGIHKPTLSHGQPTHLNKSLSQKEYQQISKPKVIPKQALPSSRVPLKRSPPKATHRAPLRDERSKVKPKRQLYDEESDGENAINMIRQMFGYNPNRFRDDDDDSDMEANFDDIMREEKRSAKIARKEDEEQLRMIEEEERRERERLAKKRKLGR